MATQKAVAFMARVRSPAITQTDANTWDLKLCAVSITTGGAITITDERVYCHFATKVSRAMLDVDVIGANEIENNLDATGIGLNADKVDGFHAAATAAPNVLLALNASSKLPADITGGADTVDGYHAADIISGGVILGAIILWSGTLGGSDGHRPMVGGITPNEEWHICNGDLVGSVQTPDLRDKFVMCAGTTYAKGATGGNAAINFSHNHTGGTFRLAGHAHAGGTLHLAGHAHAVGTLDIGLNNTGVGVTTGSDINVAQFGHDHTIAGATSNESDTLIGASSVEEDTLTGNSANGLSSLNILPPYIAMYYIMKVA